MAVLQRLLITDEKHRIRSEAAEADSRNALAAHPLPADARGGGRVCADPNSKEEILLTRGMECVPAHPGTNSVQRCTSLHGSHVMQIVWPRGSGATRLQTLHTSTLAHAGSIPFKHRVCWAMSEFSCATQMNCSCLNHCIELT